MDEKRARVFDDLRGVVQGDLLFHPVARGPYAVDASLYEIDPLGVIAPRSEEDVAAVLRYASEHNYPVHPRGAGTGLAGGCLGAGLVLDLARYMRRIVSIGSDHVVVQPGVVLDVLNAELEPLGLRLGPDPAGSESATVGGALGDNGSGVRSLRSGAMSGAVESLRVVFSGGEIGELAPVSWPRGEDEPTRFQDRVARRIATLLQYHEEAIKKNWPKTPRNTAGYALPAAKPSDGRLNLGALVVGSEGTLAVITEARLRVEPIPPASGVVLLAFGRLSDAADAVIDCLDEGPSACELHDWRSLSLVREGIPSLRAWIPDSAEAALVVEFDGPHESVVARRSRSLSRRLTRRRSLVCEPYDVSRRTECDVLLGLRRVVSPRLMSSSGTQRAMPFLDDIAVPPEALGELLASLQTIFKNHGVNWTVYAHAGAGEVHARPFLGIPLDPHQLERLATDVYESALALGGSVAGEHGCGLSRTQFLKRQYGELTAVFREVKNAFDPAGILNPGKIVGDDPHLLTRHIKVFPDSTNGGPGALHWPDRSRNENLLACNSCGACRSLEPTLRMCPTFRAMRAEAASPRAHMTLLRQLAAGTMDPRNWSSEELRENADLCVHCRLCESECPSGVDVSSLMLEAKTAHVERHGLSPEMWMLSRVDLWARLAMRMPALYHALTANRFVRWGLERAFGLARLRDLPRVTGEPFARWVRRMGLNRPQPQRAGPRVAYFVDIYGTSFAPEIPIAVVSVLQNAGVNVYVPDRQRGCGMPALVAGDLDRAREMLLSNLRVFANAVREGYTVICSEPTAALMLTFESLRLTDDLDAALVAANTLDAGHYLLGLIEAGHAPAPHVPVRIRAGYHQPCHLRALNIGTPGLTLLDRIPELSVEFMNRGCSGMAGTFGLAARNYRLSLRAGRPLRSRLRQSDLELGTTECSACRMQMEQGLAKRTYHPFELLSLAYGLNPSLLRGLKEPKPRTFRKKERRKRFGTHHGRHPSQET